MNMDCFCQFSPSSHNALSASKVKLQKGSQSHLLHTIKPYRTRRFLGSNIRHQSQHNIFVKKVAGSEFSDCSSCQSSATRSGSYKIISKKYTAIHTPDALFDGPNINKTVKKKCRKKARRKGKQSKNISRNSGSVDTEALSEYVHGSRTSDAYGYNDHGDEQGSYATSPQVSLPGGSNSKIDLDEHTTEYNCPKAPNICTSSVDEIVVVETNAHSTIRKDQVFNTETESQVNDLEATETNHFLSSSNNDMGSKGLVDMLDSLVLDSVSVSSNSSDNPNASHSIKLCGRVSDSLSFSDMLGFDSRKELLSCKNLLASVEEAYDNIEGSKYGSQNSSGSDAQFLVSGKRGKKLKALPKSSSVQKLGTTGSLHCRTEKEKNYSVWQKVQKNDVDGLKKVHGCSQFDTSLKQVPLLKSSNDVVVDTFSRNEDDVKQQKEKVPKKLKRKNNLGLKHECNYCNGRVSHTSKGNSNTRGKDNMQQNGILDITTRVTEQKGANYASRRYSQKSCERAGYKSNRGEFVNSQSIHGAKVFPVALEALVDTHDTGSCGKIFSKDNEDSSLTKSFNPLDHNLLKVQPPIYLHRHLDSDFSPIEKENTIEDCCKQTHSAGSALQKWIPIRSKDHDLITSASLESSLLHFSDVPAGEDCSWRNSMGEKMASFSQDAVYPLTLGMDFCSINSSSCVDGRVQNLRDHISWMHEHENQLVAADCLTTESKEQKLSAFEADSNKILQAMSDSCRMRLASEAVQMATGDPIAEFEKILHLSSPIICQSHSLLHCRACLQGEVVGLLNCRHERPNMTLDCLWKWYEKHGSYGLEVRAEDYENSKRIGVDRFSFRAYFVPFLSAVQLFKGHRRQLASFENKVGASWVTEKCEIGETSKDSKLDHLPIFSVLIPQPQLPSDADQLVDAASSNDVELLFEYFESDQPQTRRPLYEKVQELARGDVLSVCKMYGDPSNLLSVNVHDLHPRSWYSVAWYPIYRIPDGNLRAAFLTYHSLGHLVTGSFRSDSSGTDSSMVYPVVGLQSYNAQSECWFQPRHNAGESEAPGSPCFHASGILKERLRTLEETACLMARAAVNKGNQISVNRHPDYEFFLSRRGQ